MAIDPSQIRIDTQPRPSKPRPASPRATAGPSPAVKAASSILALVIAGAATTGWMVLGPQFTAARMADDMEEQYQMLLDARGGDMELHVRASAVAELALHAHDRDRYQRWKSVADGHARRAGLPLAP